jgi:hypothetical protein
MSCLTALADRPHNALALDASGAGFDSPQQKGATRAILRDTAFFLRPHSIQIMVGCVGASSDAPVPFCRSVNPAHPATQSFDSESGGYPSSERSIPMNTQATPEIRPNSVTAEYPGIFDAVNTANIAVKSLGDNQALFSAIAVQAHEPENVKKLATIGQRLASDNAELIEDIARPIHELHAEALWAMEKRKNKTVQNTSELPQANTHRARKHPVVIGDAQRYPDLEPRIADPRALPRHFLHGVAFFNDAGEREIILLFHTAGTNSIWKIPAVHAARNTRLIRGTDPADAMQIGVYYAEERNKEKAGGGR